jgi:hypothetical protein
MPDPRLTLTAQELIYAALGLRGLAREAEARARDHPQFESCQALFAESARAYEELAGKFESVAALAGKTRRE